MRRRSAARAWRAASCRRPHARACPLRRPRPVPTRSSSGCAAATRSCRPFRRDPKLVDAAVPERRRESVVHEAVLFDEREAAEARAHDGDVKVVASAGSVGDRQLARVRERGLQQLLEARAHRSDITTAKLAPVRGLVALLLTVFLLVT